MFLFMNSLDSGDTEIIKMSNHFCVTSIYIFSLMCAELILLYTESFGVCFFIFTKINCSARQCRFSDCHQATQGLQFNNYSLDPTLIKNQSQNIH